MKNPAGLPRLFARQDEVDSDITLSATDFNKYFVVRSASGPRAVTLPRALAGSRGGFVDFVAPDGAANPVTISFTAGDTVNGKVAAPVVLDSDDASVRVVTRNPTSGWIVSLGGGGGGGATGNFNQWWVDFRNTDPGADGTLANPFPTISQAVAAAESAMDALPPGIAPGQRERLRQVVIVAEGIYDEDITFARANLFIEFLAQGPVILGDGAGANFQSSNQRNITVLWSQAQEDADGNERRPQYTFSALNTAGESSSTHTALNTGWIVSGRIIFTNPGGAGDSTTGEFHLENMWVQDGAGAGALDATGDAGGRNCYFYRCRFGGTVVGTVVAGLLLQIVESVRFQGLLDIGRYGRMSECEFEASVTTLGFSEDLPPGGMLSCTYSPGITFTAPASGVVLDSYSNFQFKAAGVILGGAATKVIRADNTP